MYRRSGIIARMSINAPLQAPVVPDVNGYMPTGSLLSDITVEKRPTTYESSMNRTSLHEYGQCAPKTKQTTHGAHHSRQIESTTTDVESRAIESVDTFSASVIPDNEGITLFAVSELIPLLPDVADVDLVEVADVPRTATDNVRPHLQSARHGAPIQQSFLAEKESLEWPGEQDSMTTGNQPFVIVESHPIEEGEKANKDWHEQVFTERDMPPVQHQGAWSEQVRALW